MQTAEFFDVEPARLAALERFQIMDTETQSEFDEFTQLAAHICNVPIAVISLLDRDRAWFKSRHGIDLPEEPRSVSVCNYAIRGTSLLEVSDLTTDPLFIDNPAVRDKPGVRFYAGSPLITADGHAIGTLCVIDSVPRQLSSGQKDSMAVLARQVVRQLELRLLIRRERELNAAMVVQSQFQQVVLNSALAAVISLDAHGVVTTVNPAAERLLARNASKLVGFAISDFHMPEELEDYARTLCQELGRDISPHECLLARPRQGGSETREWHYRQPCGTPVPVMVSVSALQGEKSAIPGFVILAWDMTERREAREEIVRLNAELEQRVLLRTIELERTTSDLQSVARSIAHDLRQPLISVGGYSGMLQKEVTSARGQYFLTRICAGIEQINLRADALLDSANLSRRPLQRTRVDIGELAQASIHAFSAHDPQRDFIAHIQPDLVAYGDARLLAQVMHELLENAWQHTAAVTQAVLTIGSQAHASDLVTYFVRDNGEGFDMQYAESLFEPFQQLTALPHRSSRGVGLSRVKQIIDKHGGSVWADSSVGQGATFYFTLPT